jgi:hypothetical protein
VHVGKEDQSTCFTERRNTARAGHKRQPLWGGRVGITRPKSLRKSQQKNRLHSELRRVVVKMAISKTMESWALSIASPLSPNPSIQSTKKGHSHKGNDLHELYLAESSLENVSGFPLRFIAADYKDYDFFESRLRSRAAPASPKPKTAIVMVAGSGTGGGVTSTAV